MYVLESIKVSFKTYIIYIIYILQIYVYFKRYLFGGLNWQDACITCGESWVCTKLGVVVCTCNPSIYEVKLGVFTAKGQGQRHDSVGKNTDCSSGGPKFGCQYPHWSSHTMTSVSRESNSSVGTCICMCTHTPPHIF